MREQYIQEQADFIAKKHLLDLSQKYTHLGDIQLEKGNVDEATDDYIEAEDVIRWMEEGDDCRRTDLSRR